MLVRGGILGRAIKRKECVVTDLRVLKRRLTGAGGCTHLAATTEQTGPGGGAGSGFTPTPTASCFSPPPPPLPSIVTPADLPAERELSNLGGGSNGGGGGPASMHLADRRLGRCTASARHNQ